MKSSGHYPGVLESIHVRTPDRDSPYHNGPGGLSLNRIDKITGLTSPETRQTIKPGRIYDRAGVGLKRDRGDTRVKMYVYWVSDFCGKIYYLTTFSHDPKHTYQPNKKEGA